MNNLLYILSDNLHDKPALHISMVDKTTKCTISYYNLIHLIEKIQQTIETSFKLDTSQLVVAICLPQSIENLVLSLAILSKYTCVPLNSEQDSETIEGILNNVSPTLLITDQKQAKRFESIAEILCMNIATVGIIDTEDNNIPLSCVSMFETSSSLTKGEASKTSFNNYSLILTTSGTTGQPKTVGLTWQQLIQSATSINKTLALTADDTVLHALPMFHIGAFVDLLLVPLMSGGSIYVKKVSETADIVETICKNNHSLCITWYQCVPTMLHDLLRYADDDFVGKLKFIRIVSAPIPNVLVDSFYKKFQIPIIPMYGMTEAAGQITSWSLNPSERRIHSVGKVMDVPVIVLDNNDKILKSNQSGHICIAGNQVINRYLSGTTQTQSHIKIDDTLWLKTGDIGHVDDKGYLFITGRVKEIVNRGGEKISLQKIDLIMNSHQLIKECAAYAIPHDTLGEEVAMAVVPTIQPELLNQEAFIKDIKTFASEHLANNEIPKLFYVVDDLPKTISGKVKRHELKKLLGDTLSFSDASIEKRTKNKDIEISSELVNEICVLWQSVLSTDTVNSEDNFFLLGGDSLLAATFIEKLVTHYPNLSTDWLINLYDFPTAGEFARELSKVIAKSKDDNQSLDTSLDSLVTSDVLLEPKVLIGLRSFLSAWSGNLVDTHGLIFVKNKGGNKPPFYWCVQSYDEFNNIAQALPKDIPVYGMRTLFKVQKPDDRDNETLAKYYASIIMNTHKNKLFYLGGCCEGGTVMYLVAKHLNKLGESVGLLAIQDKAIQSNERVAERLAFFLSKAEASQVKLQSALVNVPSNLKSRIIRSYGGNGEFFFPEYQWINCNEQKVSMYYYDCTHLEFNYKYANRFADDLLYEIQQIEQGLPSKFQIEDSDTYTMTASNELSYSLKVKIPVLFKKDSVIKLQIELENTSLITIQPTKVSGITLSAKWLNHKGEHRQLAGVTVIESPVKTNQKATFQMTILSPNKSTLKFYQLNIGLVQEGFYWLADKGHDDVNQRVIIY